METRRSGNGLVLGVLLLATGAPGQSYWWNQMLAKPDAAQSQAFWIWPGTNVTFTYASNHFIINGATLNSTSFWSFLGAGSNIIFYTNAGVLFIAATNTGGGGGGTNVNTNCFTFSAIPPLALTVTGSGCSNIQYSTTGNLYDWSLLPTNAFQQACGNLTAWCGIPTNGYISGVIATQSFQLACANLTAWCGIPTNGYISGVTATQSFAPINLIVTNLFTTNLTFPASQSNAFAIGPDGGIVLGSNGVISPFLIPFDRSGVSYNAKLSIFGNWAVKDTIPGNSNQIWIWTQSSNYTSASGLGNPANARTGPGALIISNNFGHIPGDTSCSMPTSFMLINGRTNQVGLGWATFNGATRNNFWTMGADNRNNGTRSWYLQDQLASGANCLVVDANQHLAVNLSAPNFPLDVGGDINTSNGIYRVNGQALTNYTYTNSFQVASNFVVIVTNILANSAWQTNGNTIGSSGAFIGTLNSEPLNFKVNGGAIGRLNVNNSVQLGNTTANPANNSIAIGFSANTVGAVGGISIGVGASASANSAISMGSGASAAAANSIVIGNAAAAGGASSTAIGDSCFGGAQYSLAAGFASDAEGVASFALGDQAIANNDGSFVWSDSNAAGATDSAANQFVVGSAGGVFLHTTGAGVHTDGPTTSTNGYFYEAADNGNASATGILTPLHQWASMSATDVGSHLTLSAANTYTQITNYQYGVRNGPSIGKVAGTITNLMAGWYRVGFSVSAIGGANDEIEADVATNNVPSDIIASHQSAGSAARNSCGAGSGILFLTAGEIVSLQVKNVNSTTLTITHAQLTIGSP